MLSTPLTRKVKLRGRGGAGAREFWLGRVGREFSGEDRPVARPVPPCPWAEFGNGFVAGRFGDWWESRLQSQFAKHLVATRRRLYPPPPCTRGKTTREPSAVAKFRMIKYEFIGKLVEISLRTFQRMGHGTVNEFSPANTCYLR